MENMNPQHSMDLDLKHDAYIYVHRVFETESSFSTWIKNIYILKFSWMLTPLVQSQDGLLQSLFLCGPVGFIWREVVAKSANVDEPDLILSLV